jgi:hypothetical protein
LPSLRLTLPSLAKPRFRESGFALFTPYLAEPRQTRFSGISVSPSHVSPCQTLTNSILRKPDLA